MAVFPRWLVPALLATGLGVAGFTPAPAQAQSGDELVRVIVDVADVIMRGGQPYYRHGNYGYNDRLVIVRDRYGRPVYYRQAHHAGYDPYRSSYRPHVTQRTRCNRNGKCKVEYYDPRYDRRHHYRDDYHHNYRYSRHDDRRRWRGRYDD
jgi:hypothetical protein